MSKLDWLTQIDDKDLAWFEKELKENLAQVEAELERRRPLQNATPPQREGERNE